jgi:hypothetical protein
MAEMLDGCGEGLMGPNAPHILTALRLPGLYRKVCAWAGLRPPPVTAGADCFTLRCGAEPPELFAAVLEEALVEDGAEVLLLPASGPPDDRALMPGHVAVRPGFDSPCPAVDELRRAAAPWGGRVLLFAVERRDQDGRLVAVTWAAVPEEEPPPQVEFQAAVRAYPAARGGP